MSNMHESDYKDFDRHHQVLKRKGFAKNLKQESCNQSFLMSGAHRIGLKLLCSS